MALLLQLRKRTTKNTFTNPSLIHLFSTSSSNSNNDDEPDSTATSDGHHAPTNSNNSRFSNYFKDVKDVLKQRHSTTSQSPSSISWNPPKPSFTAPGFSAPQASTGAASFDEIRKNLSDFRRRYPSSDSTPPPPSSGPISFQEIYNRNVLPKPGESPPNVDSGPGKPGGRVSIDAIRETVRNSLRRKPGHVDSFGGDWKGEDGFSKYGGSLGFNKPSAFTDSMTSSRVIGGTGTLPASIFGREMREKEKGEIPEDMKMEFVRMYKHEELGERLRELRPEAKGGEWFSLTELGERLKKLREREEREMEKMKAYGGSSGIRELKTVMNQLRNSEQENKQKSSMQRLDILGELGRTPSFMLQPPKEHLVENYFHPDNMSSAEKLKIELAKVRDEFKMSESDCGSFRVQVATLTVKIKHLSSVLHKKDKHSRKGLLAMVQKRKRLLKYLRRTDWDSYCFVISKLGLRDNPDTKY